MTFAAEEPGEILSRDAQGRVLISRERRELLLEQYDRSGMSGVKFAEYIGIKYSTLAYWLQSPANAARSFTRSSKAVGVMISSPSRICATC